MIFVIFHGFNLQKGSFKGNITLEKTLFDGQMVKNHDKNPDHEMSLVVDIEFLIHDHDHDQMLLKIYVGFTNDDL